LFRSGAGVTAGAKAPPQTAAQLQDSWSPQHSDPASSTGSAPVSGWHAMDDAAGAALAGAGNAGAAHDAPNACASSAHAVKSPIQERRFMRLTIGRPGRFRQ
jgi:hypothetical protein